MFIASGSDNDVSLRHSPRHFPERNLVSYIFVISSVRAGDTTNNRYDSVLLDTGTWRGENPGDTCYEVGDNQ